MNRILRFYKPRNQQFEQICFCLLNYQTFSSLNSPKIFQLLGTMNIFLFHRDLRLIDNTTLIHQLKTTCESIVPVFIFPPEQINPVKNKYFNNNSVQFMIESLKQLDEDISKRGGKFYLFEGQNLDVLKSLNKHKRISSIGFNYDYTPYARKRDNEIIEWAKSENIKVFTQEDYVLYNIIDKKNVSPKTGNPYLVFTPFKNHCLKQLKVRKPDPFSKFLFQQVKQYQSIPYIIPIQKCSKFYQQNKEIKVHGGRTHALKILESIEKFKNYNNDRNFPIRSNTCLSAYLHFTTVSIRQVYHAILAKLGVENNLINELHWRDFYVNITHYHPRVLEEKEQYGKSFQQKFDQVKWKVNEKHLEAWQEGRTGFPIVDAAMREMNTTGYMHNRCRMITACFFSKDLFLDWRLGQQYFANKLTDYSPMQNSGGWQWCVGNGTDAQPYFRIFNPWTQQKNYDQNCLYIKKWIPELKAIPNGDIHKWDQTHKEYLKKGIKYCAPIVDHDQVRKETLQIYKAMFGKE